MSAPNRRDPEKHKDQMVRGAKARNLARSELVRRHRAEYDEIYAAIALENGVTPQPNKFRYSDKG